MIPINEKIFTSQTNAKYNKCYRNVEEKSLSRKIQPKLEIEQAECKN